MKKLHVLYAVLTAAVCCVTLPAQAQLSTTVARQVVAQTGQTAKTKTVWKSLLQAHNGNAEKAVEAFAGEKIPDQYSNTAVYVEAVYADPQNEDELLVQLVHALAWLDSDNKVRFYYTFSLVPAKYGKGYEKTLAKAGPTLMKGIFDMPWNVKHGHYAQEATAGTIQLYQVTEQHAQETMDALQKSVMDWREHWSNHQPKNLEQETKAEHQTDEPCCEGCDEINAALQAEEQLWQGGKNLSQQEVKELLKQFAGRNPFVTNGQNEDNCELRYVYGDKKHHEIYTVSICSSEKPEGWNVYTQAFSLYPKRKITTIDQRFFFSKTMAKVAAFDEKEELRAWSPYTFVWSF